MSSFFQDLPLVDCNVYEQQAMKLMFWLFYVPILTPWARIWRETVYENFANHNWITIYHFTFQNVM